MLRSRIGHAAAFVACALPVFAAQDVSSVPYAGTPLQGNPYGLEWLAQNHGRYDNRWTAQYEQWLQGDEAGARRTGGVVPDAAPGPDVRMSNPFFNSSQNEFQIVINPNDSLIAIGTSNDNLPSGVGVYRTTDGGFTWVAYDSPIGTMGCCDPGVSWGLGNDVYVTVLDLSPSGAHVIRSTDAGATWLPPTLASLQDRQNIIVDRSARSPYRGRIYLTYSFGGNGLQIAGHRSTDDGQTWQPTGVIGGPTSGSSNYQQASEPHVAPDGTVYVGYQEVNDQGSGCSAGVRNWVSKSTDGGTTFTQSEIPNVVQGGVCLTTQGGRGAFCIDAGGSYFRSRSHPIVSGSPTDPNKVYVIYSGGDLESAYTCGGASGAHSDIIFVKSTDGGQTWSGKRKINTDAQGKDQYYGWIDTAVNGTLWVGWHDRRDDPSNFQHRWYQGYSTNEGATWTESPVADLASQPSTFIGDYAGMAAHNSLALGMWWDSRIKAGGDPYTDPTTPPGGPTDHIVGQGLGNPNPNQVKVYTRSGTFASIDFFAYAAGAWGVNVAAGDVDAGTHAEILTGPGPGDQFGPQVRGFKRDGTAMGKVNFYAYGTLKFGVNVASGDIDGDGFAEILTGAGPGEVFGPHVRGWNFDGGALASIGKISFFAYNTLKWGVNVSQGSVDAEGAFAEILTAPGPGVVFGPQVRAFDYDGSTLAAIAKVNFMAFGTLEYGASLVAGDVEADGVAEIACAPGPGAALPSRIRGFNYDGGTVSLLAGFDVVPFGTMYGARPGAGDMTLDGADELLAGAGRDPGANSEVKTYRYNGTILNQILTFTPFSSTGYGVNVVGGALGY